MRGSSTRLDHRRKSLERLHVSDLLSYCAAAGFGLCLLLAGRAACADECFGVTSERATVSVVGPRGELTLDDHRILRLAGFDPAQATPDAPNLGETIRRALAGKLVGKTVRLHVTEEKPDRWGRLAAFVRRDDGEAKPGGVAAEALADGLGRYLAEPAAHACRAELIEAEASARQSKLGLWADPYYGVLAVDDRAVAAERTGTIVMIEGTLAEVEPSPFRTTLRFNSTAPKSVAASRGVHMLIVTISPGVMKTFRAQRVDVSRFVGRRIRVRGLLDIRFGPRIELDDPDGIEVLEQSAGEPLR